MENAQSGKRIEVEINGPYVVYGDIPLKEMVPIRSINGDPVDWHTLREISPKSGRLELCRCGQSRKLPFCDSSHEKNGFDGTEAASRRRFLERAEVDRNGGQAIANDSTLCMSAGFCGTGTTHVWKMLEESMDPAQIQLMRDMVWRCPAGSIAMVRQDGILDEPEMPQEIAILPAGPIWVRGRIPIVGSDGEPWEALNRVTLCRCGSSKIKPFCDGSHNALNFDQRPQELEGRWSSRFAKLMPLRFKPWIERHFNGGRERPGPTPGSMRKK